MSGVPGRVRGSEESADQYFISSSLERRSRMGQLSWILFKQSLSLRVSVSNDALCTSCVPGVILEDEASSPDHHETVTGARSSGREDLHRQVRTRTRILNIGYICSNIVFSFGYNQSPLIRWICFLIRNIRCGWCPQGFDRWVWNLEVPPARHAGRPPARPPSHPHQEVPGQRRHSHVVPHVHVGHHLPTVTELACIMLCIFWQGNDMVRLSTAKVTVVIFVTHLSRQHTSKNILYISNRPGEYWASDGHVYFFFLYLQQRWSTNLVRHRHPALWNPEDLERPPNKIVRLVHHPRVWTDIYILFQEISNVVVTWNAVQLLEMVCQETWAHGL